MEAKRFWIVTTILLLVLSLLAAPAVAQQDYEQIDVEIDSNGIVIAENVPFGTGLLWITNSDTVEHNVRILGPGVDRQFLSPIQPGQTKTLRIEFQEGTYTISTLDNGGQGGMSAEIQVTRGGQTGEDGGQQTADQQAATASPGDQQATGQGEQQGQQDQDQTATPTGDQQPGQTTPTNGNGQQGGEQLVQQGEQVFGSNCASCHGENGEGQVGPALAGNEFVVQGDPAPVLDIVQHGRGQMPPFEGQLSNDEIAAVVSFIRNAWDNNASIVSPDQLGPGGDQQVQQTGTPQAGDQQGQATQTPTAGKQSGQTPTAQNGQPGQQTATPEDDESSGEVPVTGPEQGLGFSVGQVALPGQSGSLDFEIQLVKVADGFTDPVSVVAAPDDSGRLFVVERNGVIRVVEDGQVVEEPFLDISDQVLDAFLEQGLYDMAFHPDFSDNGLFYVHFAEILRNGDGLIVEYRVSEDNPNAADPDSARLVLQIDQPFANHNGGEIAFGPDGYLYIGSGDGGWEGDPLEAGQDLSTLLGKLLRIDVNAFGARPYTIPQDNPFAADQQLVQLFNIPEDEFAQIQTEARPEIWAYGLRNPWKFHFDSETGDLYLPDVGQNHWEEINFQPADSQGGENYGWDFLMGTHCFPIEAENCEPVGVLPVAEYSHDLGLSVTGLGVYRGDAYPEMDGVYFVGDWGSGRVWGLSRADNEEWTFTELLDTDLQITSGDAGPDGAIYVTSCNCNYGGPLPVENPPGSLWMIVPADQVPDGAETAPVGGQEDSQDEEQDQEGQQTATPQPDQQGEGQTTATPGTQQTATPQNGGNQGQATPSPGAQQTATPQAGDQQGQATPAPTNEPAAGNELISQGQEVYNDVCSRCHGTNGQGQVGPALAGSQFVTQQDASPVINIVLHGRGAMPPFEAQLSDDQVAAVVSFIRSTWGNNAPTVSPQDVSSSGGE